MKNEKEKWVDNMMEYASRPMSSKNADAVILDRILNILDQPEARNNIISFNQLRLAGIAALVILTLNIGVIGVMMIQKDNKVESRTSYGLNSYNLDLY